MSTTRRSPVILGLSLLFTSVGLVWAQPADPLEQTRLELNIKAQKLLREVSGNLADAQSVSRSNPEKSRQILQSTKSLLEDDNLSLPERQRKDLLRQVTAKLEEVDSRARVQKRVDDLAAADAAEKIRLEKKLAADDAKAQGGYSPSMVIDNKIQSVQLQQKMMKAYLQRLKDQQTDNYYGASDKSSPKYKDIEIMKMLNSTLSVDFQDLPFKKTLEYLDDKAQNKLNFLLDEPALKDASIDLTDKTITLKMTKFTVRTVLKRILKEAGNLEYFIEDGSIRITTAEIAQKQMVIKFYPVGNLVGASGGGNMMMQMMANNQAKSNAQGLALLMMSTIEPQYWSITNPGVGVGLVDWDPKTKSLAIKASVEVHYMLKASEILNNNRLPGTNPLQ